MQGEKRDRFSGLCTSRGIHGIRLASSNRSHQRIDLFRAKDSNTPPV